jgi:hypothetical protein
MLQDVNDPGFISEVTGEWDDFERLVLSLVFAFCNWGFDQENFFYMVFVESNLDYIVALTVQMVSERGSGCIAGTCFSRYFAASAG